MHAARQSRACADTALTRPYTRAVLEFLVLGPVEVRRDGEPVAIPGGKTAELLVHLALAAGTSVRADRLLDDLWAGAPTNRNTLQQKVARLRRGLGDPALIAGGDDGYRLAVEPAAVDAHRVLRDVERRRRCSTRGLRGAAAASAAALALFRGDVLPAAGDWAAPHRARLEEARMQLDRDRLRGAAAPRRGRRRRARGRGRDALPYREGLWELLITALYRARPAGRRAGGVPARPRAGSADDLGLEPGPRLKELERQILAQDPALAARGAGTCRRSSATLVGARRRDRGAARPAGAAPPRRGRRPGRHRQDGARDRDRARAGRRRRLARPAGGRADAPTTSSTR